MKNFIELKNAIANKKELVWNDPQFIEGNDYTITFIECLDYFDDDFDLYVPILIRYGNGSEAEVLLNEILYK